MLDYPLPFILREHSVRFNRKARHSIPRIIVPRRSNAWSDKRVSISTNFTLQLFFLFNYRAKYFARTLPCNSKIQTLSSLRPPVKHERRSFISNYATFLSSSIVRSEFIHFIQLNLVTVVDNSSFLVPWLGEWGNRRWILVYPPLEGSIDLGRFTPISPRYMADARDLHPPPPSSCKS